MTKFIVFEGGEASGKSTVMENLSIKLEQEKYRTYSTREPGGTTTGERIREIIFSKPIDGEIDSLTELLLFEAARVEHNKLIKSKLKTKDFVICDRYSLSTEIYQGIKTSNFELAKSIIDTIPKLKPDITFIFGSKSADTQLAIMKQRLLSRESNNTFDNLEDSFHLEVSKSYYDYYIKNKDKENIVFIEIFNYEDGRQYSREELTERVYVELKKREKDGKNKIH